MTMTLHAATVPVFLRMLANMEQWLQQARHHAEAKRFDETHYLTMRLAPDMLPFVSQVRIAGDIAKTAAARLSQLEPPKFDDDETQLQALADRLRRVRTFLEQCTPDALEGADQREVVLPQRQGEALRFTGETFVQHWALPNFFFHTSMTYALLRHAGVALGKADFLGPL